MIKTGFPLTNIITEKLNGLLFKVSETLKDKFQVEVTKTLKIKYYALYQNETSQTMFTHVLTIRRKQFCLSCESDIIQIKIAFNRLAVILKSSVPTKSEDKHVCLQNLTYMSRSAL